MPDRFVALLLRLYPEEFRARFGPQIEADLYHPGTNRSAALFDIFRSALYHRVTSPGPYIGLAAMALGAAVINSSINVIKASRCGPMSRSRYIS